MAQESIQQIIKSPNDTCDYKIITLDNGLKTLLISDKNTKLSYAAMVVGAGSLLEKETFGLAHFLEHMLFLGNKKYPNGEKYFEYVNSHGGKTNAFTDLLRTCYYFTIDNKYLDEIIDMFAHFFIDPLFNSNLVDKEINAVNSEYHKDIGIDGYQYKYALKLLAADNHPFKNFDVGSTETLKKDNIREELIKFYTKYYVSNNMQLIILNNKPINEMEKLLKFFENVNSNPEQKDTVWVSENPDNIPSAKQVNSVNNITRFGDPFKCGNLIRIVPTSKSHMMLLTWALKYDNDYKKYRLLKYIFYLLGRESSGSLTHILINNSLIDKLHVQTIANFGDYITICIEIKLTEYGYKNIDVVTSIVMYYIDTLRKLGFDKKNFKLFSKCTKLNFLFEEPSQLEERMMNILTNICTYYADLHESVSIGSLICEYDETVVSIYNKFMEELCDTRVNIVIGSPKCMLLTNNTDKWFEFNYGISRNTLYSKKLIFKFDDIYKFNNEFVPTKLIVYKNKEKFSKPIRLEFPYEVWYNYENTHIPKVCVIVEIKLPFMYDNIKKYVSTNIFINVVNRELRGFLYDAILCNTIYALTLIRDELVIRLYGFNDKIDKMVSKIIDCLMNIDISFATFTQAKGEYHTLLEDHLLGPPFENIPDMVDEILFVKNYSVKKQLNAVGNIRLDDVTAVNIKNNTGIKCLVNGNITKKNCILLCESLQKINNIQDNIDTYQIKKINTGTSVVKFDNISQEERNSLCTILFCIETLPVSDATFAKYFSLNLLINKILSDKFFSILRTKQQLGYIVRSNPDILGDKVSLIYQKYYIQSPTYSPDEMLIQMNQFFIDMKQFIRSISSDTLKKYIAACIVNVMLEKQNITERTMEMFEMISRGLYNFDYKLQIARALEEINVDILNDFYDKYFTTNTTKRIVIQVE